MDWTLIDDECPSRMVVKFNNTVGSIYDRSFPEKNIKTRSSDLPWVTKRIKRLARRKKRAYRKGGKTFAWRVADDIFQTELNANQVRHMEKVRKKVTEEGNTGAFHAALNIMRDKEPPRRWSPTDLFPNESDEAVAENCAEFFNAISSEFDQIPKPSPPEDLLTPPEIYQIAGRLKSMKKPKSMVPGDIDPRVVNESADVLAIPLHFFCSVQEV